MQLAFDFSRAPGTSHAAPGTSHPAPGIRHEAPVPVFVRHRRAKCYVVRVRDDGSVRVTIPRGGSQRGAQQFVAKQQDWIAREQRRLERDRAAAPVPLAPAVELELRARAVRELPQRTFELAVQHRLAVSRVSVRNQKWRWGSCSRRGHICLNWRLAAMPAWVRDYVIVHELMHLKRMDHSPTFWRLVAKACPEYEAARRWLRQYRGQA